MSTKSMENCNLCKTAGGSPLVNCAACKFPFHMKCIAPQLTIKDFDAIISTPGFYFYCNEHCNLSVHNLLKRISRMEDKFRKCFKEISDDIADFHVALQNSNLCTETFNTEPSLTNQPEPTEPCTQQVRKRKQTENIATDKPKKSRSSDLISPSSIDSTADRTNLADFIHPSTQASGSAATTETETATAATETIPDHIIERLEQGLFALPQIMKVFLSKLPPQATTTAIENHLGRLKIPLNEIKIEKFEFRNARNYSSFVINVTNNESLFRFLLNASNWPFGIVVHPYENRSNFHHNRRRGMW